MFRTAINGTPSRSRLIISQYASEARNVSQAVDENGEPLVVDMEGVPVFVNNDGDVRIAARYGANGIAEARKVIAQSANTRTAKSVTETVDVVKYNENSAGHSADYAQGVNQAPIADFVGNIAKFAGTVNNVFKAGSETYFQSNSDSQDSQRENKSKYKPDTYRSGYNGILSVELPNGETAGFSVFNGSVAEPPRARAIPNRRGMFHVKKG